MSQRAAVLGYGVTGESVVRYLLREGIEPVVLDTRPVFKTELPSVEFIFDSVRWPKLDVDFAVVSPGLAMDSCLVAGAAADGIELRSDIDLFFGAVAVPVIGITGTNGKSTVTSLAGHIVNCAGRSCGVGGNLGVAALDIIDDRHECYVLELSSFQLERSREHAFHAATVLNVTEDHLDKHADMRAYVSSKQRIYTNSAHNVYNRADPLTRPHRLEGAVSFGLDAPLRPGDWGMRQRQGQRWMARGDRDVCSRDALGLPGAHNELNALAACALTAQLVPVSDMVPGLSSFSGLAHRFETVRVVAGVTYVNDSKATNLGATMAALTGMPAANQVVLIAGGDAKGVDLSPLAAVLPGRVRVMVTLGADGPQLLEIARRAGVETHACDSLEDAVRFAAGCAVEGDTVLLSPACASLDMFSSYVERGERFAAAVAAFAVTAESGGAR